MNLCDTFKSFGQKITPCPRDTRYCSFAPPEETIGVIDLSTAGDGSRGIAFLTDRLLIELGGGVQRLYYSEIRVMEILPSYETPFEDELLIGSSTHEVRISDCSLNKFFLRQLISNISRISVTMRDSDREELHSRLTQEAFDYYSGSLTVQAPAPRPEPLPEAAALVQEIAAAKRAALLQEQNSIELTEEKINWLSGKQPDIPTQRETPAPPPEKIPEPVPAGIPDEDITDMTREQTMSYLLDSIAEINSEQECHDEPQEQSLPAAGPLAEPVPVPEESAPPEPQADILTPEPDSPDIYIQASRRIRELCEDGRLTMDKVNAAVKEQLIPASELYSTLDIQNAALPPAVKTRALKLSEAADRLPEYFRLGEDIAARVMFFMLYQLLSYTDRIVQSDETKQRLNYFFVRFGAAGMILSMLDANN